ncbi:aldolase [Patescibacteria group bacterium]|nr:aldolase [Patescibacteria group bacterium]
MISAQKNIPVSVPKELHKKFLSNLEIITKRSENCVMFAGDQRFEHNNSSFLGKNISEDDLSPKHLFNIADISKVNLFATQFGLIDRYSKEFNNINYVVKLNSLSKLSKEGYDYSFSEKLISPVQVLKQCVQDKINIVAFGYTIYIGIKTESQMLSQAQQVILEAHSMGYPVILWAYPKGKAVTNENDPEIINTACSIANCLGADIAKINAPQKKGFDQIELIETAVKAAGNTKILISGGESISSVEFLKNAYNIVNFTNAFGVAVGRNIHQKPLHEAVTFCNALEKIVIGRENLQEVLEDFKLGRNVNSIL